MSAYEDWFAHVRSLEIHKNTRKTRQWLTLEAWVREKGWARGAEIGLARGWTIFHLLQTFPQLSMIGVDQWIVEEPTGEPGQDLYNHMFPEFCARMVKDKAMARYPDRCRILHMDSQSAVHEVKDESLDFVFIDADHREAAVTADIEAWSAKVRPGGYVTGHDWHRPEVRRVLDTLLPGWELHDNHCWRIQK